MGLNLFAKILVDGSQMSEGMNKALDGIKTKLAAAFSIGAVVAFGKTVNTYAMDIVHLSEQYSLTTDEAQKLAKAAGRIGLEADTAANAIYRLANARRAAAEGDVAKMGIFASMGVDEHTLRDGSLNAFEFAKKFSDGLKKVGVTAKTDADILELVGIRGVRLLGIAKELAQQGPVNLIQKSDLEIIRQFNIELKKTASEAKTFGARVLSSVEYAMLQLKNFSPVFDIAKDVARKELMARNLGTLGSDRNKYGLEPGKIELANYAMDLFMERNGLAGSEEYQRRRKSFLIPEIKESGEFSGSLYDNKVELAERQQAANKIKEIEAEITKERERGELVGVTDAQKRIVLEERLKKAKEDLFYAELGGTQNEILAAQLNSLKAENELKGVKVDGVKKNPAFSDSSLAVGNFLGAGRSTLESVAQKSLHVQIKMAADISKMANKKETTIHTP